MEIMIKCFIQEYKNKDGLLSARLVDKNSLKHVILTGKNCDKDHFLMFLSQIKINNHIAPTIYDKEVKDYVAVRGNIEKENDKEIIVNIDTNNGGYLLE